MKLRRTISISGIAFTFFSLTSFFPLSADDTSHFAKVSSQTDQTANDDRPAFQAGEKTDEKPAKKSKPWYARLTVSGAYNSNVIGRGKQVTLPSDISNERDWLGGVNVDGGYRVYRNRKMNAWLDGRYRSTYLADLHDFDVQYAELSPRVNYRLAEKWIGAMRGIFSHTFLGYDRYGYSTGVNPSLTYLENSWANVRFDYALIRNEYFYTVEDSARDQDGITHTFSLTQNVKVPDTRLTLSGGFNYGLTNSDGSDYDYHNGQVFINLWHPLVEKTQLRVGTSYGFWNYIYPNTRANRHEERIDHRMKTFAEISRPVTQDLTGFIRYQLGVNASNINDFHYKQHLYTLGLTQEF